MHRYLWLMMALSGALLGVRAQGTTAPEPIEDEVLVRLKPGVSQALVDALPGKVGGRLLQRFAHLDWAHLKLARGLARDEATTRLLAMAGVLEVEPNYRYQTTGTPNDPSYSQLWGLAKVQASAAWQHATGSPDVVVAVVDTGIRTDHEDLTANLWRNPAEVPGNGVDDDGNGYVDDLHGISAITRSGNPMDDAGHGTHVAGTIGATGNNGVGVAGVNWAVKLMALRFLDAKGSGTAANALACYEYAISMRKRGTNIRVINNSWGGPGASQAMKDAIDTAGQLGILSVAAAGNDGRNIDTRATYPAAYASPYLLTVAASDQSDNPASFSNFSATRVGLAAPGVAIRSTHHPSTSAYTAMSGTSMAAPHVAGAAALLASRNPALTVAQLKAALLDTVDVLPQWADKVSSGGRLNLARAMARVAPADPGRAIYQPDLLIRTHSGSAFIGDNLYTPGDAQTAGQRAYPGSPAVFHIQVQNDGTRGDVTILTGPAGSGGWTLRYYDAPAGGRDITAQMTGGGWRTPDLAPGTSTFLRLEMLPDAAMAGTTRQAAVAARSATNSASLDTVTATATAATGGPLTAVALTVSPTTAARAGEPIAFTADAGTDRVEYRFVIHRHLWLFRLNTAGRAYGTAPTMTWTPSASGTYTVTVYARATDGTEVVSRKMKVKVGA